MTTATVTRFGNELGTARYIGTFENGSPEWHEQRSKGIGGSDVGSICGLSQYESPYSWMAKRLGKIPNPPLVSEAAEWGTILEPVILDWFERNNPDITLHRNVGTWSHSERPWQQANPDALYEAADGSMGVVEVKTAKYEDQWDEKTGTIPPSYRAQVTWYLSTFGFKHAYVVVLFSGSKPRVFEVTMNEFESDVNVATAANFWDMVNTGTMPPFSAPYNVTYEAVRFMHPDIDDTEVELGVTGREYFEAVLEQARATAELDLCKSEVLALMGNAKRGLLDGNWVVTRQARGGGTPYLVNKRS